MKVSIRTSVHLDLSVPFMTIHLKRNVVYPANLVELFPRRTCSYRRAPFSGRKIKDTLGRIMFTQATRWRHLANS